MATSVSAVRNAYAFIVAVLSACSIQGGL